MDIQMVDLRTQHAAIKDELDAAIGEVLESTSFVHGPQVGTFECHLAGYLEAKFVLGVANGTDALQIAMMATGIGPGHEVITPSFTFVATAEAAALLGARVVFCDIEPKTFNIAPHKIEELITERTRAIVPVHLFGQPADMDPILEIARKHDLIVIEDNAQSIGAEYRGRKSGTIGHVGTLSFFPSKNLGACGDGGAVMTQDERLYHRMRVISNHGSERKYHNEMVGVNSRLDTLQAAVLGVKLRHLDRYVARRQRAASRYDQLLSGIDGITTPSVAPSGTHVYHQYTIRISRDAREGRDGVARHLKASSIPFAIYYPVPLHRLPVFSSGEHTGRHGDLTETERASEEVLSLPMHSELSPDQQSFIVEHILHYLR